MPIIGLWSCPTELKRSSFWQKDTRTALTGYFTSCFRLGSIALPARLENENSLLVVTVVRAWGNGTLAFRSKFSLAHRSNSLSLFSVRPVICYATLFCFANLGRIYEQRRVLLAHCRYLGHMRASQTVWFQYNSVGIGHLSYDKDKLSSSFFNNIVFFYST